MLHLAADPYPDVSNLAMKVLNSIAYKVGVKTLFTKLSRPWFSVMNIHAENFRHVQVFTMA